MTAHFDARARFCRSPNALLPERQYDRLAVRRAADEARRRRNQKRLGRWLAILAGVLVLAVMWSVT